MALAATFYLKLKYLDINRIWTDRMPVLVVNYR